MKAFGSSPMRTRGSSRAAAATFDDIALPGMLQAGGAGAAHAGDAAGALAVVTRGDPKPFKGKSRMFLNLVPTDRA